ncbi:MAG TPA: LysR family transcriptional regulator [Polyangiaceae bacterium]|nr:LysR family transcriptional regulator [Polyangiaceae bacterium]
MQENYGRDLDLNLLRVFCVVAEAGSVTAAAGRLYLTQPAVSAALRRLTQAVGAPLFVRQGRRLVLSSRGSALRAQAQPHLAALVDAALAPARFDPLTSERVLRLGIADSAEAWLLPQLLELLARRAPRLRLVVTPVQFRNVADALTGGHVDLAVTVADALPASVRRKALFWGDFVCLFDKRHVRPSKKLSERTYFEHEHVIVSYNADLRGIVEDMLQKTRKTRCSVTSFANIAAIVENSALLATVPRLVARAATARRPHLAWAELPFQLAGADTELLWPSATDDDEACAFLRAAVIEVVETLGHARRARR